MRGQGLQAAWRSRGLVARALWPLSRVYAAAVAWRRRAYDSGCKRPESAGLPLIVVGNVIAGGAGKTPVTLAVVEHLRARGCRPGIVSRGYGRSTRDCREALPQSPAAEVGDEPALLARTSGCPVFVAARRMDAVRALRTRYPEVDVIVSDDGLQHLAMGRDIELCVFNDEGTGNGWLLPAGPLREPWPRPVTAVLHAGDAPQPPGTAPLFALQRRLAPEAVNGLGQRMALSGFAGQRLEAVAAIARPERFFAMLQAQGLALAHVQALPDHYNFESFKRLGQSHEALICTEKDAVKLWTNLPQAWAVALELELPPAFWSLLDARLESLERKPA